MIILSRIIFIKTGGGMKSANIVLKGTVVVILCDPPLKKGHARITTVPSQKP